MFSVEEIEALDSIYDGIRDDFIKQILSKDEIDAIYEPMQDQSMYRGLINRVLVPSDTKRKCSIRLQRIHNHNNLGEWLQQIASCLQLTPKTQINVAFRNEILNTIFQLYQVILNLILSFLSRNPLTDEKEFHTAWKDFSTYRFCVDSKEELTVEFDKIGKKTDAELLHETMLTVKNLETCVKWQFSPYKICMCYLWVTK